jgi:hypothetical protein
MSRVADGPSQCNAPLKLRADQPVDPFNQGDSLKSAVFPAIPFVQNGTGKAPTQNRCNEFKIFRQRSGLLPTLHK